MLSHYIVSSLEGLTASGMVHGDAGLVADDVTFEGADLQVLGQSRFTRCEFDGVTIDAEISLTSGPIEIDDSWLHGSDPAVDFELYGAGDPHATPTDGSIVISNTTFTDVGVAVAVNSWGTSRASLSVNDSIFDAPSGGVLAITLSTDARTVTITGGNNLFRTDGPDLWPTGDELAGTLADPMLDTTFSPPRPMAGSPAVDAGDVNATATDYWGQTRSPPDIGAVER